MVEAAVSHLEDARKKDTNDSLRSMTILSGTITNVWQAFNPATMVRMS